MGGQLQAIRDGLGRASSTKGSVHGWHDDGHLYQRTVGSDRRAGEHADAVLLFRGLTVDELRVLELRYWVPLDGHERTERNVPASDLVERLIGEEAGTTLSVKMTRQGETFFSTPVSLVSLVVDAAGGAVLNEAGEPSTVTGRRDGQEVVQEDRAIVQGVRTRLSSYESIACALGYVPESARKNETEWFTYKAPKCRDEHAPYLGDAIVAYCRSCGAAREVVGAGKPELHRKGCTVDAGAKRVAVSLRKAREKVLDALAAMRESARAQEIAEQEGAA